MLLILCWNFAKMLYFTVKFVIFRTDFFGISRKIWDFFKIFRILYKIYNFFGIRRNRRTAQVTCPLNTAVTVALTWVNSTNGLGFFSKISLMADTMKFQLNRSQAQNHLVDKNASFKAYGNITHATDTFATLCRKPAFFSFCWKAYWRKGFRKWTDGIFLESVSWTDGWRQIAFT